MVNRVLRGFLVVALFAASARVCDGQDAGGSPTARQARWLNASLEERQHMAERLGEEGAERIARQRGLAPILRPAEKAIAQGPDSVWLTPDRSGVVVIEAKGGTSPLGSSYGYQQGTIENAVGSAERVLASGKASVAELQSAEAVIDAARRGRLEVWVARTAHVLGEPKPAVIESVAASSRATSEFAARAVDDLASAAGIARSDGAAAARGLGRGAAADAAALGRGALAFAVILDLVQRGEKAADVEGAYDRGEITERQRTVEHVRNGAEFVGGWGGAIAGAGAGAEIGSAAGPGGAAIGGLLGGGVGYVAGERAVGEAVEYVSNLVESGGEEDSAESLLQIARNLRLNRADDSASTYYRRVLAQYPNSKAAEQARFDLASCGR